MSEVKIQLGLDGVIGFRERLGATTPSTSAVGTLASLAGVDGLCLDLRGPLRKAAERDAQLVRESVDAFLTLVLSSGPDLMDQVFDIRPNRVIIGPQSSEVGPESPGMDASLSKDVLKKQLLHLRDSEFDVGVIIEPDVAQVKTLHRLEASVCVLSVDGFIRARAGNTRVIEFNRLQDAADLAKSLGMTVGLRGAIELHHCSELVTISSVSELYVGHSIIGRSMLVGVQEAIGSIRRQLGNIRHSR